MELASKYNPADVEGKWYQYWLDHKLFSSKPDGREPYTIVIPPPNVTGVLHMGHVLNETIQDILIRRARMDGKNACWVPGTDHASIATEAKVVNRLAEKGIKKSDLTREEFLKHAWEWTDEHGGMGPHGLHHGRETQPECHQGVLRPVRQRTHLSRCAHGELGSESTDGTLGRRSCV